MSQPNQTPDAGRTNSTRPQALQSLLTFFDDPDEQVFASIRPLVLEHGRRAVKHLIRLSTDADPLTRERAAELLAEIETGKPRLNCRPFTEIVRGIGFRRIQRALAECTYTVKGEMPLASDLMIFRVVLTAASAEIDTGERVDVYLHRGSECISAVLEHAVIHDPLVMEMATAALVYLNERKKS
jgi:HEAT repeat protein